MPNASAAGSLIVAAPSGSYGTGTPQKPLTIVSGTTTTTTASPYGLQLIDAPTGNHAIRVYEASLDLSLSKIGLARDTATYALLGICHLAYGTFDPAASYDLAVKQAISTGSAAGSFPITGNTSVAQAYGSVDNQIFRWPEGLVLPPGQGLYLVAPEPIIPVIVYYRVMYDVP